jgi:CBS domain-containing protein
MKTCRDLMTREVKCCLETDTVDQAAQLMKDQDIGPVPIVEEGTGRLIGIVTDRDLAVKVVAEGRDPKATRISDIMTSNLITCGPTDSVDQAVRLMEEHQIRRIPVCDDSGRIQGIIAQADIATRTQEPRKTAAMVEKISEPSVGSARF